MFTKTIFEIFMLHDTATKVELTTDSISQNFGLFSGVFRLYMSLILFNKKKSICIYLSYMRIYHSIVLILFFLYFRQLFLTNRTIVNYLMAKFPAIWIAQSKDMFLPQFMYNM